MYDVVFTIRGRLFHSLCQWTGIRTWFRRILSSNILWRFPVVLGPGPLGISGLASVPYFAVTILYSSSMSPPTLRYASFRKPSLESISLYSRSRKPGMSLVALRCTFSILVICFLRHGVQIWLAYYKWGLTSALKRVQVFFLIFLVICASNESFESSINPTSFSTSDFTSTNLCCSIV